MTLGTQADNIADKVTKDRQAKGIVIHCAKLTDEAVVEIRQALARGESQRSIAKRYGVRHAAIGDVSRGLTWRHVEHAQ